MKTGGDIISCTLTENPDMEIVIDTVDLELRTAIDSDILAVSNNSDAKNTCSFPATANIEYELDFEKIVKKEEECLIFGGVS